MGKPTKGQQLAAAHAPKPTARIPREGVKIRYSDDTPDLELSGDFEAQLTPSGSVCFIELVPDLLNQNKGEPVPIARRFVNLNSWAEIELL